MRAPLRVDTQPLWDPAVIEAARRLLHEPKSLPAWLFYDAAGSALFERITELPEYYLTRTEEALLEAEAEDILARAFAGPDPGRYPRAWPERAPVIAELGAGTARKTERLLRAALRREPAPAYLPGDVSGSALRAAWERLAAGCPALRVAPVCGPHEALFAALARLPQRKLVLFIGSSIGNYEPDEAQALLRRLHEVLQPGDALLLGTDMCKPLEVLLPAYDDAAQVTAQFNLNMLARLNREAGARFDPGRFRHIALWNAAASRIEMHLESRCSQQVPVAALGIALRFREGERIHTENSHKYDAASVDRLLHGAGFRREHSWHDAKQWFGLHLARA
ncbi:L-histidine N(alpha)-methyltransferase [Caldimonas tepidiphila]|uniref:L-histidine N(alpha)-methyltransferase n=1 Tax=Caldimonas tepidiphila TaxID=2315841 RepID=UPI000E5BA331|nr:L-histidine N(alpha)-methyltransferase [Caldimonas tepidiphila]